MFCPSCGKQIPDGHKFCGNCGWGVGTSVVAKSNEAVKQVTSAVASGASKAKEGANKKIGKFKFWLGEKDNKFYFFAILFMLVPILIAMFAPAAVIEVERQKQYFEGNGLLQNGGNFLGNLFFGNPGTEVVSRTIRNPFRFNGMASVLAIILYSIVLCRNKNTMSQFDKNNVDKRVMTLHILNLVFFVTVCSLFTTASSMTLPFMREPVNPIFMIGIAILLSAVSMRSLSGIFWIIAVVSILSNLQQFNDWEGFSAVYVISAYISIIIQVLMLKLFNIDLEQLKQDFMIPAKQIQGDVQATIDTGSKAVNAVKDASKVAITATTGVPVAAIPSGNKKSKSETDTK